MKNKKYTVETVTDGKLIEFNFPSWKPAINFFIKRSGYKKSLHHSTIRSLNFISFHGYKIKYVGNMRGERV